MRPQSPFLTVSTRSLLLLSLLVLYPAKQASAQTDNKPPKKTAATPTPSAANGTASKPDTKQQKAFIDGINNLTTAITDAQKSTETITALTKTIMPNLSPVTADDDELTRLSALITAIGSYIKDNPADSDKIQKTVKALQTAQEPLKTLKEIYDKGIPDMPIDGFKAARDQYETLIKSKDDPAKSLKNAADDLTQAVKKIPGVEKQFCDKVAELAATLTNLPSSAARSRLSDTLKNQLPNLTTAVHLRYDGAAKIANLNDAAHLKKALAADSDFQKSLGAAEDALDQLSKTLRDTLGRLDSEFARLTADALMETGSAKDALNQVLLEPRQFAEAARARASVDIPLTADLDSIMKAAKLLLADGSPLTKTDYPPNYLPDGNFIQSLQNRLDDLKNAKAQLTILATELNYAHPFDITMWEADQIPLFYFNDVARLIQVINPDAKRFGGDNNAQLAAQSARVTLDNASQTLQNARAKVEDVRLVLAKRAEEMRLLRVSNAQKSGDSDAKTRAAQKKADETAAALRSIQQRHDVLKAEATRAKAEEDAAQKDVDAAKADSKTDAATLARRQARLATTRSRADDANERVDVAQAAVTKASSENDAAQADLKTATGQSATSTTELNNQLTALQTQLDTALTNEQDAEAKERDAVTSAFLTAQAENAAFAFARDNAPYWMAVPTSDQLKSDDPAVSTDPSHRVMLFAFPNSRTLFIRGSSSDVAQVKEMVAKFDQPQAQADMTVYTMEIASQANKGGVNKAMEAVRQIEEELTIHQIQVETCLTYLRQLINQHVKISNGTLAQDAAMYETFYAPRVLEGLPYAYGHGEPNMNTAGLYLPLFLPRPAGAATLAEALIVLALAKSEIRNPIIEEFTANISGIIKTELDNLPTVRAKALDGVTDYESKLHNTKKEQRRVQQFPNLRRLFLNMTNGSEGPLSPDLHHDSADVTSFQQEIIGELKNNAISGTIIQLRQFVQQDAYFAKKMDALDERLSQVTQACADALGNIQAADTKRNAVVLEQRRAENALAMAARAKRSAGAEMVAAKQKSDRAKSDASLKKAIANAIKEAEDANDQLQTYAEKTQLPASVPQDNTPPTNNTASANANALVQKAEDANSKALKSIKDQAATTHNSPDKAKGTPAATKTTQAATKAAAAADQAAKLAQQAVQNWQQATANWKKAVENEQTAYEASRSAQSAAKKASEDFRDALEELAVSPKWKQWQNDIQKLKAEHNQHIDKRSDVSKRMLFSAVFALSTMEVKRDNIETEFQKFRDDLVDTQSKYDNADKVLTNAQGKIRALAGDINKSLSFSPNKASKLDSIQQLVAYINDVSNVFANTNIQLRSLQNTVRSSSQPINPFAGFNLLSVAQLIARTRGETRADWYQQRHAALARTNETLKRFILAVDEDIKGQYVNPLLKRLQMRLLKADLQVGIVQKTSILSSNRLIARVDPKASASLSVGDEQNILQESLQLAQIVTSATKAGATAAATNGAGSANAALGVLQNLNGLPQNAPPGVYGITTGNVFQVTPIFDPTGQAMHFQFDYVAANQVRESSGQTNPQIPRIERHSISTEVQLSNYQMRAVSTFLTNSQIGRPTRYSGGIPILKDIPFLNQIPLIGWFTRSGGHAALVQQNVVLAHTSMYPTIQDVIDSLVRPSGRPETDFTIETPENKVEKPVMPPVPPPANTPAQTKNSG